MTTTIPTSQLSSALLGSIKDNIYPDSEEVLTSELPPSALPDVLKAITDARAELESQISSISRAAAPDVDEWIAQAKNLSNDIAKSKAIAREIIEEHAAGQRLAAAAQDSAAKVELLDQEIRFNTQLSDSLRVLTGFSRNLQSIETAIARDDIVQSAEQWELLDVRTADLRSSNAKAIISQRLRELHSIVREKLESLFNQALDFSIEDSHQSLRISHDLQGLTMASLIKACEQVQILPHVVEVIAQRLNADIFEPLISSTTDDRSHFVQVDGERVILRKDSDSPAKSPQNVVDSVSTVLKFLHTGLPPALQSPIAEHIVPDLVSTLVTDWLTPSVPIELDDTPALVDLQSRARTLADILSTFDWPAHQELTDWADLAPSMWLTKRRISSLNHVRKAFAASRGLTRSVERVEREIVSQQDSTFGLAQGAEDWDAGWNEEHEDTNGDHGASKDEDEADGWGFDDDDGDAGQQTRTDLAQTAGQEEDEAADSWGWDEGDDSPNASGDDAAPTKTPMRTAGPVNGTHDMPAEQREVVLRETYTITDIPDFILEIIGKDLSDAQLVKQPSYSVIHASSPSAALLALPTFVLAMFRASALSYYATALSNGDMHLYNDSTYIAQRLSEATTSNTSTSMSADLTALSKFARAAYARELDVQRTVLGDLLDGAQGFVNCTQPPYSRQCEDAVASVVGRFRILAEGWRPILSHSALLQSLGSLLGTVVDKVVAAVEEHEDITELESQRLTAFCVQISELNDLFLPEQAQGDEAVPQDQEKKVPLTAVYVSSWLRFQYLANILESSLVDIKYLWTEGELSLEFSADEVCDLIRTLFAESANRSSTIAEIRRSRA